MAEGESGSTDCDVQPARDPLQVSAFLKPAARASSSEQNQRFGFFSVR